MKYSSQVCVCGCRSAALIIMMISARYYPFSLLQYCNVQVLVLLRLFWSEAT